MQKQAISFEEGLKTLIAKAEQPLRIKEIIEILSQNSVFMLCIILCAPTALPTPGIPGISSIIGIAVMIIFMQLLIGRKNIWLPSRMRNYKMSDSLIKKISETLLRWDKKMSRFTDQRATYLINPLTTRLAYAICIFLTIPIWLPLPFSNCLPSVGIILICLSFIQRDGYLLIGSIVYSVVTFVGMAFAYHAIISKILSRIF